MTSRICIVAGCPAFAVDQGRCADHLIELRRVSDSRRGRRGSSTQRGYGSRWQRRRKVYLAEHPLCCDPFGRHPGRVAPATDVDHIRPLAGGGRDDETNYQALCHACHSFKTATLDGGFGQQG